MSAVMLFLFSMFIETAHVQSCTLSSRFVKTTVQTGMRYYTDRTYTLTVIPSKYIGMRAIIAPNDDRDIRVPNGYLTYTMPFSGNVYVAFDRRAKTYPHWLEGFKDTGDIVKTSYLHQNYLKIYKKFYYKGECLNLGGCKAPDAHG